MGSEPSPMWDFCGFANGSSFRTKYFMDESTMTLTPCGEFALVIPQTLPLLFFSVLNFQLIPGGFPPFDSDAVSHIFTLKMIVCAMTIFPLSISFGMAFFAQFYLKPIFLIEYSVMAIAWASFAAVLFYSRAFQNAESFGYIELRSSADESAGLLSRIFFCWTNILIQKGGKLQLNSIDDVFLLPPSLEVSTIERQMIESSPTFFSDGQHYSLSSSLLSTFGFAFFSLAILRVACDAFTFAGPILLHLLVDVLESPTPNPIGFLYAALMVLCSLLAALVRAATVTSIYDKLLMVPMSEMSKFSSGAILNFISTDVDRLVNFCNSFHAFWSLPVQLAIALYLLYREIGMAFVAGVVAAIVLIPLNKWVTNSIGRMSVKLMQCKDQRIKVVRETMEGIRAVKSSAWEGFFERKINELREKELYYLKIRKCLDAICVYMWASAPLLITISILATYTMVFHQKLTAAKVFTSLALVNILIMPLNAFPWVLNGLVEALVSLRRLQRLFVMKNMDGKIIGISGDVGSGKSTLLLGLLGETKSLTECIGITQDSVANGIGYVGQERWLYRGSVRENITAGKDFDAKLYDTVIKITCLQRDINLMPGGDQYEISDNGASLSGGQRTRVALARALYQDNSMYLLDEPLASLDRPVADSIWVEAIEKRLRDRGCLVVIATHDKRVLSRADEVIMLGNDGRVSAKGTPKEVLGADLDELGVESEECGEETELERIVLQEEEKRVGTVKPSVARTYYIATGRALSVLIIVALFLMQFSKNGADWWLSRWTKDQSNFSSNSLRGEQMDRSVYFLMIYASIATANTIFTLIRAFLFAYGGIRAARHLHESLLRKLLRASSSWWDRTPSGRVINRICSDVYTCDDNLPFQLNILLATLFNLIGTLVITIMGLPLMLPVIILLLTVYYFIQKYYRLTTVELKRLTSLSLSPFYSHLGDTVNGLATIRAQRFVERFAKKLRERLTMNMRAQFSSIAAGQWLSIRLSIIAVSIVAAIAMSAVVQHQITGVDSGLVALAITYALSLTGLLNGLLSSFIETEKEMVSVERIDDYLSNVPEEEDSIATETSFEFNGRVEFSQVSLRYNSYLPLALDNINISIAAGEKVVIVGRTGSGKSSLFQALLRLIPIESGKITVDGTSISSIPLAVLRRSFGVVPQHPFIFSGSLHENLVVGCEHVDESQVSNIARVAHLDSLMARIGGLDGQIEEGGKNLSFGERQIIAICRILLAKCKVVLIDEATSHLDVTVHRRMMSLISAHLPMATVICITHVLHGLTDFDTVIEMANGKVLRQGPPSEPISHEIRP
ncbi:unnamed protein product [Heligmosomoides polygyrus]|uniref:ABC-type xenobiotic transporter n=1 Tax=Heligmosomoides polygyrus TaxID=6339 RepID=A0A3P7XCI9_HELPZ|nr:unnamed protein product [Heligmosomoides polygyrus]